MLGWGRITNKPERCIKAKPSNGVPAQIPMETKEKKQFFKDLHIKLAKQIGANPNFIGEIRSSFFEFGTTRETLLKETQDKLNRKGYQKGRSRSNTRRHSIKFYQDKIAFLKKLTDEDWKIITQKTEYDRGFKCEHPLIARTTSIMRTKDQCTKCLAYLSTHPKEKEEVG